MTTTHPIQSTGETQCERVLARLKESPGEWVPMPALVRVSGSYVIHSRIADLRKRGNRIDHRNRRIKKQCLSEYRLAEESPAWKLEAETNPQ
jgi:hypothetical protein